VRCIATNLGSRKPFSTFGCLKDRELRSLSKIGGRRRENPGEDPAVPPGNGVVR
jgi:hypothetical protein